MLAETPTVRPPLTDDDFLQPAPWCVVRRQAEGFLLYNPRTDELHLLPATAFFAYRRCDGLNSVGEIARDLAAATGTAEEEARQRVRTFLTALLDRGLLLEEAS